VLLGKEEMMAKSRGGGGKEGGKQAGSKAGGGQTGAPTGGNSSSSSSSSNTMGALDARLYAAMVRRNLKIGEIASSWDTNHNGKIDHSEFQAKVTKLVPFANPPEVTALFDSMDIDGGGFLDLEELKSALKQLQAAAERAGKEEAALVADVTVKRKAAGAKQEVVRRGIEEDAHEVGAAQAKAQRDKEERERAEAIAREAARAAKVERLLREAEEKRAFDARVAAKQKKQPGLPNPVRIPPPYAPSGLTSGLLGAGVGDAAGVIETDESLGGQQEALLSS